MRSFYSKALILLSVFVLLFTGCSKKDDYRETTIKILKKGKIENDITETFNESYYDAKELKEMMDEEVASYNRLTGTEDSVEVSSLKVEDGMVNAVIIYNSSTDYAGFNNVTFFYGSVDEAKSKGYDLNINLVSPTDNDRINGQMLDSMGDSKMIIWSEPVLVKSQEEICYISANVEYVDENSARMSSDSSGYAYVVLKD